MPKLISNALTPLKVKNAAAGRYSDGGGLQLLVKATGSRSWVFRFTLDGRTREVGLGPAAGAGAVSLADAREQAADLRRLVKSGIDPIDKREKEAGDAAAAVQASKIAGVTFRNAAETYIATHEKSWRNPKHRQQWKNTLSTYAYPVMGDLPVGEVGTPEVMAVIEPIWLEKPETASRVRGRIEAVLDAAKARGQRSGENPARWRGHIQQMLPARKRLARGHHKAMPYDRVPAFVSDLHEREAVSALALEFIILTACRSGEARGARWTEVDFDKGLWTVPASRMKAGREHRVPLAARALEILGGLEGSGSKYLFPGGDARSKLSETALNQLLKRMNVDVTVHGFRSSFRDWAAEQTSFAHEVCEMALAHVIGNKAEAAYRRGDLFEKRRKLMEAWAAYCLTPAAAGTKVSPIRGRAK
jgi:integrase